MTDTNFALEHFYYGQIVQQGKPTGEQRLLAASAGITPEMAALAVDRVTLPPLIRSSNGAWALVRGRDRSIPFLLVQSQQGSAGQVIAHYILPTPEALRVVAGNLQALMAQTVQDELPAFQSAGEKLPPLQLVAPEPLTVEAQVDDILDLMNVTRNKINVIESLLAAIVQGVQLVIQGAPADLKERVAFIEGVLALLPPSARFGVTFTTHSLPSTQIDAQIRFYSDDLPPEGTLVFNWASGQATGAALADDYSRFVISQLRLDAELVIQRTAALTSIAGWRINRGDRLADALGYAAQRVRVDEALRNNQPVDKDEVSKILAEDPTLSDELRVMYARHLIRFSLAMEDMSHANAVSILLRPHPELERAILRQMEDALNDGLAWLLYDTLVNWLSNPLGPEGKAWVSLTQRAALGLMEQIAADGDPEEVNTFVESLQSSSASVPIADIVPQVVKIALPFCDKEPALPENLFLLAVKYLSQDDFRRLMNTAAFRDKLPSRILRLWGAVTSENGPPVSLAEVASSFGMQWERSVLLTFAELAVEKGRLHLLDKQALAGLLRAAQSEDSAIYAPRILGVINAITDDALPKLEQPGPFTLLQIRLVLGDYAELGRQMLRQSAVLYPGDLQIDYLKMVERLFDETPLPAGELPRAMSFIQQAGVKSAPYVMAVIGALQKAEGSPELDVLAAEAGQVILGEQRLLSVIPPRSLIALLEYHVRRKDVTNAVRVASLTPLSATYHESGSPRLLMHMYRRMDWDDRARTAALELLRKYVREAGDEDARKGVVYFGRELGDDVRRALEVTYTFRRLTGDRDIVDYSRHLRSAVIFLQDTVALYADSKNTPDTSDLTRGLESLPGSLSVAERRALAREALALGEVIAALGRQYRAGRARDEDRHTNQMLTGEADPRTALDVFWTLGGYFARGKRLKVALPAAAPGAPFGKRTSQYLREDINATNTLLRAVAAALPVDKPLKMTAREVRAEIESLWGAVPNDLQRQIVRDLAQDLQNLVELVAQIEMMGDVKALEDGGLGKKIDAGKHRPRGPLELYRFIHGFYAARS